MIRSVIIAFIPILLLNNSRILCQSTMSESETALLVVSYDGFRPDYLNRNVTPNLNKFRAEGTSAEFMMNVFPTKTYVNHFTIATGMYAETHGVLSNDLYDSKLGKYIKYSSELFHYNNNIIPIWVANELAEKTSGCMMWAGSDFEYKGVNCTFKYLFDFGKTKWYERVDIALSWFQHKEKPANLVMLYIEDPDEHAHAYGPESDNVTNVVAELDNLTGYIQNQLIKTGLDKRVNVIHVSDHGMNTVIPPNFIDLRDFVEEGSCEMYGTSPVKQIVPVKGREDEVFIKLSKAAEENGHFKVYNKDNIPSRWHAKSTVRLGPIFAVADVGYGFQDLRDYAEDFEDKYGVNITNESTYGVHGYDNEEESMHAIFMAKGPLFNKGKTMKSVNIIDLYNLFCLTLKIPCESNDGSSEPETWSELFINESAIDVSDHHTFIWLMSAVILVAVLAVVIWFVYRPWRYRRKHGLLRNEESVDSIESEFQELSLDNTTPIID